MLVLVTMFFSSITSAWFFLKFWLSGILHLDICMSNILIKFQIQYLHDLWVCFYYLGSLSLLFYCCCYYCCCCLLLALFDNSNFKKVGARLPVWKYHRTSGSFYRPPERVWFSSGHASRGKATRDQWVPEINETGFRLCEVWSLPDSGSPEHPAGSPCSLGAFTELRLPWMALKASLLFLQHLGITRSSAYQLDLLGATSSWSLGPSLASSEQSSSGFGQQPEGSSRTERPLPTLWFLIFQILP